MLPFLDSMLNENNARLSKGFLLSQIEYHHDFPPFARRPLTTFLINGFADFFAIERGLAFVWVNFSLLFIAGILLYCLSKNLGQNLKKCLMNLVVFYGSFSVCFAFFPPIFSYDEPLQYSLVFAGLLCLVKKRPWLYVLLFTLACISKETTVLLVFALPLFAQNWAKRHLGFRNSLMLVLPVLFFCAYLIVFSWQSDAWSAFGNEISSRMSCFVQNFGTPQSALESLFSFFLALWPFFFLLSAKRRAYWKNPWARAFLFVFILNSAVVAFAALARESRLFALPLLFLWPVFAELVHAETKMLFNKKKWIAFFGKNLNIVLYLGLTALNFAICYLHHRLKLGVDNLFTEYLFIVLQLMLSHFCLSQFLSLQNAKRALPKTPVQK